MEAKLLVLKPAKIFGDPNELAKDEVWFNLTRESAATAALRAAPRQAVFEGFDSIS